MQRLSRPPIGLILLVLGLVGACALIPTRFDRLVETNERAGRCEAPDRVAGTCRPFADDAWLNRPLPKDAREATGPDYVDRLMDGGDGRPRGLYPITPRGGDYYHPVFLARRSSPSYRIVCSRTCIDPDDGDLEGRKLRIPCRARPASGSDGQMAVIDRRSGREWDLGEVRVGDLRGCRGGRLRIGTAGLTNVGGDGRLSCATAGCLPLTAGIIRFRELSRGRINHALFMVDGVECDVEGVYPADVGQICYRPDRRGGVPEGQTFRLERTPAQIDALEVSDWQKTILRAMARYGMVVGEQGSNGAFEFQTESPETHRGRRNPWRAWAEREATKPNGNVYVGDDAIGLDFPAGIPDGYFRRHLVAVDSCVVERTC